MLEKTKTVLSLQRIHFSYRGGAIPVLAGVDLEVARGGWVTLVGPSGCGKTTLLKVACGLLRPARGRVLLAGEPVDPRGKVAYMPQHDTLLPWRTALGNLLLPAEVEGRPRKLARREALSLLSRFGLDAFANSYPGQLSGGMRQRVALIRTFLTEREVLLLDEPLSALDALTRAELRDWLRGIWEELGRTVVLVTHDVEEAVVLSDEVCVLSSRPARVLGRLAIPLPRPRDPTSSETSRLRGEVLACLRGGSHD
ncbi:MAG: ABC transporter related protein [Acetothermia bacterium 64_32]|nr:MAG: ABC transporter related protein [Acetothermia bacterium 64_32]HAF70691.1 ABC transporter [Candidatus Acetothermia bacterium]